MPAAALLNLLFPPQCLSCDALVGAHGTLCMDCWRGVHFIAPPCCACCGLPFEFDIGEGAMCGECLREAPPFARARAALRYDDHSRALITKFKYADQTLLAPIYGKWLASAGRELIAASDVIVPVPLYYWRFVGRRYNQAALIAQALARHSSLPVLPDALLRTRHTQPQAGLTRAQRLDNVKGAFEANPRRAGDIHGKGVLLIDDVMTTGATIRQCARALTAAGAASVNVLTLARTT